MLERYKYLYRTTCLLLKTVITLYYSFKKMRMLFAFTCLQFLAAGILHACFAARVELNWDVGKLNVSRDGFTTWESICINNALPIPHVHVTQGDVLILNVHNSLDVFTSVHAHGIYHNYTDYYDGTEMVTECGIPPGENFTYIIDTGDQAGNFWIHGHVQAQFTDGFRTPFIIHEKARPDMYDEELVLSFEDWGYESFYSRINMYSTQKFRELTTDYRTLLINGIDGNISQPINFEPGKRYRLRVFSLLSEFWIKFEIPEHKMVIVGKDGVDSQPLMVDGLDIGPGQRFSVIVTAHNATEFNYNYCVTLYTTLIPPSPGLMPRYYTGLVQYKQNAPLKQTLHTVDKQLVWGNVINMQARDKMPLLPMDRQIMLSVKQYNNNYGLPYYSFGEYAFNHTLVPTLFTALTTGNLAVNSSTYGPQTQAHVLHYNESIEVLLYNNNSKDHSMHLHMTDFQVVEVGPHGDAAANNQPVVSFQQAGPSPMRCDTVTVRAFSYAKLRFRVERGSIMLFHCHMVHGGYLGLAATFIAAPDMLQKHMQVPDDVRRMCKLQGIKTSGNGAGNDGFDMTGLPEPFLVHKS